MLLRLQFVQSCMQAGPCRRLEAQGLVLAGSFGG